MMEQFASSWGNSDVRVKAEKKLIPLPEFPVSAAKLDELSVKTRGRKMRREQRFHSRPTPSSADHQVYLR
jgi:hypothetical protein